MSQERVRKLFISMEMLPVLLVWAFCPGHEEIPVVMSTPQLQ